MDKRIATGGISFLFGARKEEGSDSEEKVYCIDGDGRYDRTCDGTANGTAVEGIGLFSTLSELDG